MISQSKLRGPIGRIGPYAVAVFLCLGSIEAIFTGNFSYSAFAFGCFFIIMGIIEYHRTRLVTYLILGLLFGTGTWHSMARLLTPFLSLKTYIPHVIVSVVVLVFSLPILLGNEKLESNARRLFNLAAELLQETSCGFTPRPYSTCKAEYTIDEIRGFARFMNSKNIVKSLIREKIVTLSFSMGISPLMNPELQLISFVSFDIEGNISVYISEHDYKLFKEKLTFDHLCESMADVFKRFLEYYKKGYESRIIVELKSGGK